MFKSAKKFAMYEAISPSSTTIVDASVNGFVEQKIKYWPSDEFLFIVEIFWSDKRTTYVKRTYREFEAFHELLKQYLLSNSRTGVIKSSKCVPPLQGRRLFQKNSRELAEERETELHNFLKQLIPGNLLITSNNLVLEFFQSRSTDPRPCREPSDPVIDNNGNTDEDDDEDNILFDR